MRKIIALLLCLMMIVPQFAVSVSAGDGWYPMVMEVLSWKDLKYEMSGEWVEAEDGSSYFLYYAYYAIGTVRLTMNTGEWVDMTYEELQENFSNVYVATSQSSDPWTECGTYCATLFVEDISCEYSFDIVVGEEAIESFEVLTTNPLIKEYHGWWYTDHINGGEYFSYNAYHAIDTVEVTYDSGRKEIMDIGTFNYVFDVTYGGPEAEEEKPSALNPWEAGTTHRLSASIDYTDITCEFEVEIIENPVSAIEVVETVDLIENSEENGQYYTYADPDGTEFEFYEYDPAVAIKTIRVYFSDGTSGDYTWNYVSYYLSDELGLDLGYCVVRAEYYQDPDNPWLVGNTYNATLEYAGRSAEYQINILPEGTVLPDEEEPDTNAIANIELISMYPINEFAQGYYVYDSDENGETYCYYYYDIYDSIEEIRVTYADGSVETGDLYSFPQINVDTDQSHLNQWDDGVHTFDLCTGDGRWRFALEILDSGIVSVDLGEAIPLVEGLDGYYDYYYDSEADEEVKYFVYCPEYAFENVVVTFEDEFVMESPLEHMGQYAVVTDQSIDNHWEAGNSYDAKIYVLGQEFMVNVMVVENPVESIAVYETTPLVEGIDSYTDYDFFDEDGNPLYYERFDVSNSIVSVKVNYKDGTSAVVAVNDIEGGVSVISEQSYETPFTVGMNTAILECYGVSCQFEFEIIENPVKSIEVIKKIPIQEHTCGYYEDEYYDEELGWIGAGDYYYSPSAAIWELKVNYTDGTSETITCNMEEFAKINTRSDQDYGEVWIVGNEYIAYAEYMGRECQFTVEIVDQGLFSYYSEANGLVIDGFTEKGEESAEKDIVIPSEINGIPVVGIWWLPQKSVEIESITFPETLEYIDRYSFTDLDSVKKITFKGPLDGLHALMFYGMSGVEEYVFDYETDEYTVVDGVVFDRDVTQMLLYPEGKASAYVLPETVINAEACNYYKNVEFIVHENSEELCSVDGFIYSANMRTLQYVPKNLSGTVVITEGVENMGNSAMFDCTFVEAVILPSTLKVIGCMAFSSCESLGAIVVPEGVEVIEEFAFEYCYVLNSITLPSTLTEIRDSAFEWAYSVDTVYFRGTEEQWNEIVYSNNNMILEYVNVVYLEEEQITASVAGTTEVFTVGDTVDLVPEERLFYIEELGFAVVFAGWEVTGLEAEMADDGTLSFSVPESGFAVNMDIARHGDATRDDKVNALDKVEITKQIKSGDKTIVADTNFDGRVNALDKVEITKIIKGTMEYETEE